VPQKITTKMDRKEKKKE